MKRRWPATHCLRRDFAMTVEKAKTGVEGLDDILAGGLSRGNVFLLEGAPGAGKTTIAMQFLLEGAEEGESCLYITLSETEEELRASAKPSIFPGIRTSVNTRSISTTQDVK